MKNLILNKTFGTGFFLGILLVILLNIFLPTERYDFNNLYNFGFPFSFYRTGYTGHTEQIKETLWLGLTGDFLFALVIGSLTGISLRFLADKELNPVDFK